MNKDLILEILDDHHTIEEHNNGDTFPYTIEEYDNGDTFTYLEGGKFYTVAEEISQMFCNKFYNLMYVKYRFLYRPKEFCKIITDNIDAESAVSGFTVEEIKHSLEIIGLAL